MKTIHKFFISIFVFFVILTMSFGFMGCAKDMLSDASPNLDTSDSGVDDPTASDLATLVSAVLSDPTTINGKSFTVSGTVYYGWDQCPEENTTTCDPDATSTPETIQTGTYYNRPITCTQNVMLIEDGDNRVKFEFPSDFDASELEATYTATPALMSVSATVTGTITTGTLSITSCYDTSVYKTLTLTLDTDSATEVLRLVGEKY